MKSQKAPSTGAQTELGTEQPQPQAVPIPIYSTYAPTTATPGSWQLSASGVLITAEHDGVVTHIAEIVESGVCAPSPREAQANAALIASAPELLCERDSLRSELAALRIERDRLRAEVESLRAACIAISESVPCQSDHCRHYGLVHGKPCDVEAVRMVRAALERNEP